MHDAPRCRCQVACALPAIARRAPAACESGARWLAYAASADGRRAHAPVWPHGEHCARGRGVVDSFWAAKVAWCESGDLTPDGRFVARTDGLHYIIGAPMPGAPASCKGYGGSRFQVTFVCGPHAGTVVVTDNLWCQGGIPDEYRDFEHDVSPLHDDDAPDAHMPLRQSQARRVALVQQPCKLIRLVRDASGTLEPLLPRGAVGRRHGLQRQRQAPSTVGEGTGSGGAGEGGQAARSSSTRRAR